MKTKSSVLNLRESWRAWFTVGIGVKRWLIVLGIGAIVVGTGISALIISLRRSGALPGGIYGLLTLQFLPLGIRILLPLLGGSLISSASPNSRGAANVHLCNRTSYISIVIKFGDNKLERQLSLVNHLD